ncbi:MAG: TonB family protein [Opitutales bacterium]
MLSYTARRFWPSIVFGFVGLVAALSASAQIYSVDQVDHQREFVSRAQPKYPWLLREKGITGEVLISAVIDDQGHVQRCDVVGQTDRLFGEAGWNAVWQWSAKPALKEGKPVWCRKLFPIVFTLENADNETAAQQILLGFPPKGSGKLPPAYRYDFSPTLVDGVAPVYPYQAWMADTSGDVDAVYAVDAQGRVVELTILKASAPEFGQAFAAAVQRWHFKPATNHDGPCLALARVRFKFDLFVPSDGAETRLREQLKSGTSPLTPLSALDSPLRPLNQAAPLYPLSLVEDGLGGDAVIECIVDREGWVQLPRIISATREEFGWAAMAALREWRFAVPTAKGKPVDALVRIPFKFAALSRNPAAAPAKP